jgi:hypothetical protein
MNSSYKRFSAQNNHWRSHIDHNHSSRFEECDEPDPSPPVHADSSLDSACQIAFAQMRSPYTIIIDAYPDRSPQFSSDFIRHFTDYFKSQGPDSDILFEYLTPSNASTLTEFGFVDLLLPHTPDSFGCLITLLDHGGIPAVREFIFKCGLWSLFKFSTIPDFELSVVTLFRSVCAADWDYFDPIIPPMTFDELMGDVDFPDVYTRDILANLYQTTNEQVLERLLQGLCILFAHDKRACVAFGDWYLGELPRLIVHPRLGLLSVEAASHAFKHAQLVRAEAFIGLIANLLAAADDVRVRRGLALATTVVDRWQLSALDGSGIVQTVVQLANEGSFTVKADAISALCVFLRACEFPRFKEFVAPSIMDLVFGFFNEEGGVIDGDHDVVAALLEMMVIILERFIFTEPDSENLKQMTCMYRVLQGLTADSDVTIASNAHHVLARLSPYWIEQLMREE